MICNDATSDTVTWEEFGRVNYCSSSISVAVIKYRDNKQLRGGRVYLSHNSRLPTIIVGEVKAGA